MIDLVLAALCSFTYSVSPAIQSPYGAAIDRAIGVIEAATDVEFTRVPSGGDLEYLPMPPLMFDRRELGIVAGVATQGDVLLLVVWPKNRLVGRTPATAARVRTNIALHETLHWLGLSHSADMLPTVSEAKPSVPLPIALFLNEKCGEV